MNKYCSNIKNTICGFAVLSLLLGATLFCVGCKNGQTDWGYIMGRKEPPSDEEVQKMLNANDPDTRRTAIVNLSKTKWIEDKKNQELVSQMARPSVETSPIVRAAAIRVISKLNREDFLPIIEAGLKDKSEVVRYDSADFFADHKYDPAILELQRLAIDDEFADVRTQAAKALKYYRTDPVYRTLLRCMEDDEFNVRNAAYESLVAMTGVDHGRDPANWAGDQAKLGKETLPARSKTIYRKRPWWDWFKMTKESVQVEEGKKPQITDEIELPKTDMNDLNPIRIEEKTQRKAD